MEIFEGTVHETGVYSARLGLNDLAFERFPDLKENRKREKKFTFGSKDIIF